MGGWASERASKLASERAAERGFFFIFLWEGGPQAHEPIQPVRESLISFYI